VGIITKVFLPERIWRMIASCSPRNWLKPKTSFKQVLILSSESVIVVEGSSKIILSLEKQLDLPFKCLQYSCKGIGVGNSVI
jgi:hypothetical protein